VIGLASWPTYTLVLGIAPDCLLLTSARGRLPARTYVAALAATLIVLPTWFGNGLMDGRFSEFAAAVAETRRRICAYDFQCDPDARPQPGYCAGFWARWLAAFAVWDRFANLRAIAIAYVLVLVAMIALHAKSYYPIGAYPVLFAAEPWHWRRGSRRTRARGAACRRRFVWLAAVAFAAPYCH